MKFKEKDFIEIEFTARTKDGEIFDSNIEKDLKEIGSKTKVEPFIFCLGQGMFLKAIDDYLIGKEPGKYTLELEPEKAFGKRQPNLINRIPLKLFKEHNVNPVPGILFNFDGRIGKVLAVSGGRVILDFNNPIAGKDVIYEIKILKKVEDEKEQIKAFIKFLFKKELAFEIKENKIIISVEKSMAKFVELFADKFKDIFNKDLEVKELKEKSTK